MSPFVFVYLETWEESLDDLYDGDTFLRSDSPDMILGGTIRDDTYEFQLGPQLSGYYGGRLLIGELTETKNIISVDLILCDSSGNNIVDDFGNPIRCTSSPHDFGNLLDITHRGYDFAYMKCHLKLKPKARFKPHKLFFHCEHPSRRSRRTTSTHRPPIAASTRKNNRKNICK